MIVELILKILFVIIIFCGTTVCGMPLVFRVIRNARGLTKIILSFVTGFIILSFSGIAANALSINIFLMDLCILILCFIGILPLKNALNLALDRYDRVVLGLAICYCVFLVAFFDWIVMWMAGDVITHASLIRMIVDGNQLSTTVYPIGSTWNYYPKAFHFYSAFWASISSTLVVVQTIPVILSTTIPAGLYCLVREMHHDETAVYAFVLACFCFPAHYAYLIWAGYPSIAAEMLVVAALICSVIEWRLLAIILPGILVTHPRFLAIILPVLGFYWLYNYLQKQYALDKKKLVYGIIAVITCSALVWVILHHSAIQPPLFITELITNRLAAEDFITRWFFALLSLFGVAIALYRRDQLTVLCGIWLVYTGGLALLSDVNLFSILTSTDRIIAFVYLPLAVFAAFAVYAICSTCPQSKGFILIVLTCIGTVGAGAIMYSYAGSWALPKEDYTAMMWLNNQSYHDTICITLDETGGWVYPLTGIRAVNGPEIVTNLLAINKTAYPVQTLIKDPLNLSVMESFNHHNETILVYASHTSLINPGYKPPFSNFYGNSGYPRINFTYSYNYYDHIYEKEGMFIAQYKKG